MDEKLDSSKISSFIGTLENSIEDIVKNEGYVSNKVYKKLVSTEGDSFLGELYEIDIKGITANGKHETNLFIKKSFKTTDSTSFIPMKDLYSREAFFYKELSAIYAELQAEANIPEIERYKVIKSYGVPNSEAIILKNMAKLNYSAPGRMEVMSLRFAQLAVQELAKFHALSFVLENKRPEYFDTQLKSWTIPVKFNEAWKNAFLVLTDIAIETVDNKYKQRTKEYVSCIPEKIATFYRFDESRICCLCHGNYKNSNILKKEVEGEVVEIIPLDYQLAHCGSPVTDFIHLLYLCADSQFRKNHMEDLKDLYHETLRRFLKYFEMDVEKVYPREEFDIAFQDRIEFALILTLYVLPLLFVPSKDGPDLSKDFSTFSYTPTLKYYEKLMDSIKEMDELGLL